MESQINLINQELAHFTKEYGETIEVNFNTPSNLQELLTDVNKRNNFYSFVTDMAIRRVVSPHFDYSPQAYDIEITLVGIDPIQRPDIDKNLRIFRFNAKFRRKVNGGAQ